MRTGLPVAAAMILLCLCLAGVVRSWSDAGVRDTQALLESVTVRLARGDRTGYVDLLRDQRPALSWRVQLRDRDGRLIASWPRPLAHSWGMLSPALEQARDRLTDVLTQSRRWTVYHDGSALGELTVYQLRGLLGLPAAGWLYLLTSLLALAALLSLTQRAQTAKPAARIAPRLRETPGTVERLSLRLGEALGGLDLGVLMLNGQGQVVYMNTVAQRMTGWSMADARHLPALSVLRPDNSDAAMPMPESWFSDDRGAARQEWLLAGRHGQGSWMEVQRLPFKRRGGQAGASLLVLRDIARQRQQINSLQREAQLASRTLDFIRDGVAVSDRFGRLRWGNQPLCQMFGYAADELNGMTLAKLLPVPFLNDPEVSLQQYLEGQDGHPPAVVGWRKDASTVAVDLLVRELFDDNYAYLLLIRSRRERLERDNLALRLHYLREHGGSAWLEIDPDTFYINEANAQACAWVGHDLERLRRMTLMHLLPLSHREDLEAGIKALREGHIVRLERDLLWRDTAGVTRAVRLRLFYSADEEPPVLLAVVSERVSPD